MQKPVLGVAQLVPSKSVAQFVIEQLLAGIEVSVVVDGQERKGLICNIDLAPPDAPHFFAKVHIPDPEGEGLYVRVAVLRDGKVNVLQHQDQQ